MLNGFNSKRGIVIKTFTKCQFSLWLPLRLWTFTIHFFQIQHNRVSRNFFLTDSAPPPPHTHWLLVHLKTSPQWIRRPGAKERGGGLLFRSRGEIAISSNFFQGTTHFSGGPADQLTMVYSFSVFLPFLLIIHTSGKKKGVLFSF